MSKKIRLLLAATIALIALSAAASTALAAEATVSPAGEATATSLGLVTFRSSLANPTCRLILLVSLHRGPIAKTVGALIGYVRRVSVEGCNGGISALILNGTRAAERQEVMWHMQYVGILGTLPSNVTGLLFNTIGTQFQLIIPNEIVGTQTCLYEGNVGALLTAIGRNPYTTGLVRFLEDAVRLIRGTAFCPGTGRLAGAFGLAPTQTITRT